MEANPSNWKVVKTNKEGEAEIHVSGDSSLVEMISQLTVRLSKTSGSIQHRFLCVGNLQCESFHVMLEHLTFDNVYQVIDDTSEPVSGRVLIDGTQNQLGACPLFNATVCLYLFDPLSKDFTRLAPLGCVQTDNTGYYEIPSVMVTTIRINGHILKSTITTSNEIN